jgi:hypothetical protein
LFHYSESCPDATNPRKHAQMPTRCPDTDRYDWDIELKSKDAAIRSCVEFRNHGRWYDGRLNYPNLVSVKAQNQLGYPDRAKEYHTMRSYYEKKMKEDGWGLTNE